MLEAEFEFEGNVDAVLAALLTLPPTLLPLYFSHEEKVEDDSDRIEDRKRFASFVARSKSGFFLLGDAVTYSVRIAAGQPIICNCFIDVLPSVAIQLVVHMSKSECLFGFACEPSEREQRNRITLRQGANKIDSWVGRDTRKYLPGFYWITLLPTTLATKHEIPLSAVKAVAQEHVELRGGQHHLFRFYESPEDWQATSAVAQMCASLPGVFDIEKIKPVLAAAKNFLELNPMLKEWR